MQADDFAQGDKLAVITAVPDGFQYSFHGAWLPDDLRAQTPEEIGAFLHFSFYKGQADSVELEEAAPVQLFGLYLSALIDTWCPIEEVDGSTVSPIPAHGEVPLRNTTTSAK